jgi:hypothetical protein
VDCSDKSVIADKYKRLLASIRTAKHEGLKSFYQRELGQLQFLIALSPVKETLCFYLGFMRIVKDEEYSELLKLCGIRLRALEIEKEGD